ncbi:hypothetical protein ACFWNK_01075 [Streptomyces sp. NPDC058417]|uniref:hypothetical protein n=1 Tax=unclassified Streptomyces TaxID=2593676 RepID=UPI0036560B5F
MSAGGTAPAAAAAWVSVCFRGPVAGTPRHDGTTRAADVVWCSVTGSGSLSVRTEDLSVPARGPLYRDPMACGHPAGDPACDAHLRLDPDAARPAVAVECADVLVSSTALTGPEAGRRVRGLLVRYPGCLVAAVPVAGTGSAVLCTRNESRPLAVRAGRGGPGNALPLSVVASVTHAWVTSGRRPEALCCVSGPRPAAPGSTRTAGGRTR